MGQCSPPLKAAFTRLSTVCVPHVLRITNLEEGWSVSPRQCCVHILSLNWCTCHLWLAVGSRRSLIGTGFYAINQRRNTSLDSHREGAGVFCKETGKDTAQRQGLCPSCWGLREQLRTEPTLPEMELHQLPTMEKVGAWRPLPRGHRVVLVPVEGCGGLHLPCSSPWKLASDLPRLDSQLHY